MRFSEFLGNHEVVDRLKGRVVSDRSFHAYIFEGMSGIGKKRLSYTMAQALLCKNISEDGEPCQHCTACKKIMNGNHSDVHYITVSGNSIKDEQIEQIQSVLFSKPFDGERTILIINKADTMTVRAQNRLLKTLEEPAPSVTIILLTEKIGDLLPTIVSRSAVMRLKPVERSIIKDYLIREMKIDCFSAEIAAAYSSGNPGKAIRLIEDSNFIERRKDSIICARGIIESKSMIEFISLFKEDYINKENILDFLDMMIFWYRDLMLLSQNINIEYIMNKDYLDSLKEIQSSIGLKKICTIIDRLEKAKYDIVMNVNINYALKNMYLEIN